MLVPMDFMERLSALEDKCLSRGVVLSAYCVIRDPWEQARLWRRSRGASEISAQVDKLVSEGADFIAQCIMDVGKQNTGPRVTGAIPGLSWHQWGEAADYCPVGQNGEFLWGDDVGFQILAEEAKALKLVSGVSFTPSDRPHVQARGGSPLNYYSIREVDDEMRRRFGS